MKYSNSGTHIHAKPLPSPKANSLRKILYYMCMCAYACVYVCMPVYAYVCMCMCVNVCSCVCMCTDMHAISTSE